MRIEQTTRVTIPGRITLAALRELVNSTKELSGDRSVSVQTNSDQREGSSWVTVTIS